MKKLLALFLYLVFAPMIHADGFGAGTLVKTRNGYHAIEQLACDDYIACFDGAHQSIVEEKITWLHTTNVTTYIRLINDDDVVEMASDQRLYIPPQRQ